MYGCGIDEVHHEMAYRFSQTKQIGDILFGEMSLPGATKTKTGAWSTDASILEELAAQGHALPRVLLDWRQLQKLRSTYTEVLREAMDPKTNRVSNKKVFDNHNRLIEKREKHHLCQSRPVFTI